METTSPEWPTLACALALVVDRESKITNKLDRLVRSPSGFCTPEKSLTHGSKLQRGLTRNKRHFHARNDLACLPP